MIEIFPSLISSDILNLERVIKSLNGKCSGYHIDVMDDHFVPNLTWGPMFVDAILEVSELPIHLHLMVDNPGNWLNRVNLKRDDILIFHLEVIESFSQGVNLIDEVKHLGCKVGIALNPKTPVESVFEYLYRIDHVLIMSVEPGFSGQRFIEKVVAKIDPLMKKKFELGLNFKIGMDGGIGKENIAGLHKKGVCQFGVASSIFSKKDYLKELSSLMKML